MYRAVDQWQCAFPIDAYALGVVVDIAVGRRGRPLLARFARGALGGVVADLRKSHV